MHFNTVIKYMRRSPYQAISAFLIMTLTFFSITLFGILTILSIRLISYFESRPQLTVFFKEIAKREEILSLEKRLEDTGKTSSIIFVSKDEALKIYKEQNKSDPILLDLVTSDVLPASIEVQAVKAEDLSELAGVVKQSDIVEEVVFQKDIVDTLVLWTNAARKIGLVVVSVLVLVSIFVILTIIGIKITIRRDEIEIMKLIGASNWFIRAPFLLEGALYGLVGAVIGWTVCVGLVLYATPSLEAFLRGTQVLPIAWTLFLSLLGFEVLVAGFLGAVASYLAVLRYLK